jgi:hypothetical protein
MSTGDKRSVSTDALETLGTILGESCGRDAIHLAVEPVIAGHRLDPGADVGLVDGKAVVCDKPLGIVDPFLKKTVKTGERFWLVVYPRQITSLRHVWSHPDFADSAVPEIMSSDKDASEAWLINFCKTNDCPAWSTVREVIESEHGVQLGDAEYYRATNINSLDTDCEGKPYLTFKGIYAHCDVPDEFWDHAEIVTGRKLKNRPAFFSCSC